MKVKRRDFLAGAAGAGIGFGLGVISHQFPLLSPEVGPDWSPGAETFVPSTCMLCPAHCGIRARLVDGMLSRIDGNPLHPVSQGGLCPKGRAGVQLLYHPGRIRGPLERIGPPGSYDYRRISWDAALDRVAQAMDSAKKNGRAGSVEWLVGDTGGIMGELIAGFSSACGSDHITVDDYRDGSSQILRLCQGIEAPPAFDLTSSDLILSFGASLSEAWWAPSMAARMRDAHPGNGPHWIQADVRLSRSAAAADRWIPIRPGAYGALAVGLLYLLLKEGAYDAEKVSRHVSGWEDWVDPDGRSNSGLRRLVLQQGRPDDVSARTGVPVTDLVALAKMFARASRPVAVWDQAVSWRKGGLADAMVIHALNIITGGLNRSGGVLVQAPLPLQRSPDRRSGEPALARAQLTSTSWSGISGEEGSEPAPVLFMYKSNPVASSADGDKVHRALSKVPLVVSFSPFFDESARCADLVLPDHTFLERWQDAPAPAAVAYPVWGLVQPVTRPIHDTRSTGDVILAMAAKLGGEVGAFAPWSSMKDAVRERGVALADARKGSAFVDEFRREELRELASRGWWLSHGRSSEEYWSVIAKSGGWFDPFYDYHDRSAATRHPDGKVWVFPPEARKMLGGDGGEDDILPSTTAPTGRSHGDDPFPLTLIPYRVMTLASGSTALMPWLLEHLGVLSGSSWEAWVEVNPETAAGFGVREGQRVRVESEYGDFEATARLFEGAQPGVVNVPYGLHTVVEGWGKPRTVNPLVAVGNRIDSVSGLPDWYSSSVTLVPVEGGA